jgi:putative flavoprotein involved in K+ transport
MPYTDTVIIGAGQAGLAMSRCLTDAGRDHVVLERGRLAERWRTERWPSLRLFTPNWMTRLPGWSYRGSRPDAFMARDDLVAFLTGYADSFSAPVQEDTAVVAVGRQSGAYRVLTSQGAYTAANVVVATGAADLAHVPDLARGLSPAVHQVPANRYHGPASLPPGGVLVVGASATGVQLAEELHRSGRPVVLAAGRHTRVPRTYRGMDIMWWLDRIGAFDRTPDSMADLAAARREPSFQLAAGHADLDLAVLADQGVQVTGRLQGADGRRLAFADDLGVTSADADRRLHHLLQRIDVHAAQHHLDSEVLPPGRSRRVRLGRARTELDLRAAGISTVLWATGYRRAYPWLHVGVLDGAGEIRHTAGITAAPGLYVLGLRFQRSRRSSFIDGVADDARFVLRHLSARASQGVAA